MSYHTSSGFSLDITMDVTITNFLNEGNVHPNRASHRTAASCFSTFLKARRDDTQSNIIKFTRGQLKELRAWDPLQPPNVCPKLLTHDTFFAHFLIETLKAIQDNKFGKPTLRARQG